MDALEDTPAADPDAAPPAAGDEARDLAPERMAAAYRWWSAGALVLAVVSVIAVPFAVYAFLAPGHAGLPYEGRVAWLCGIPVWGMVECVRKARAARAALR